MIFDVVWVAPGKRKCSLVGCAAKIKETPAFGSGKYLFCGSKHAQAYAKGGKAEQK
jgi:hypothetical protein